MSYRTKEQIYRQQHRILPFSCVKLHIPRKFLLKLLYSDEPLTIKEWTKTNRKLREIEQAQNKLNHARSIVEKILLKKESAQ